MSDAAIKEIEKLEERRYEAMRRADVAGLGNLLSEGLVYTHSNAAHDDKGSYLEKVGAKFFDYHRISHEEQRIRIHGDAALVTGVMKADVSVGGTAKTLNNRYLAVWLRDDLGWRFAAYGPTPIASE